MQHYNITNLDLRSLCNLHRDYSPHVGMVRKIITTPSPPMKRRKRR